MHWAEKYVGEPYTIGDLDCAGLAIRIQRDQFGKRITLPQHAEGVRAQAQQIDDLQADFAAPVETPEEGDAVLMKCRGRFSHIGIYCLINGTAYVLHAMQGAGQVVLHREWELPYQSLTVEGYYRWK